MSSNTAVHLCSTIGKSLILVVLGLFVGAKDTMDNKEILDIFGKLNQRVDALTSSLEHQLKLAREIQRLSSIVEFGHIKGFEISTRHIASSISGGDYFDVLEVGDFVMVLLSAASNHSTASMLLRKIMSLSEVETSSQVMKYLCEDLKMQGEDNLSIFLILIGNSRLNFCNIGDNVGWIQREDDLSRFPRLGVRLSLDNFTIPKDVEEEVPFGSRIVLASYGLVLSTNDKGEPFGVTEMEKIISQGRNKSPHDLKHEILFELGKHTEGTFNRDATLVIADVKEDTRQYKLRLITDG